MLKYKGKYNIANVFVDEIDETTVKQIYNFLNHPAFAKTYIAIMPDCHAGKGAMIGFTMKMNNYVIPNVIGVDIGCGIDTYNLGSININLEELDDFIRHNVPYGYNVHNSNTIHVLCQDETDAKFPAIVLSVSNKIGFSTDRAIQSVGSLGGGNHFIELNIDARKQVWLTIHSGSRQFGHQVATYHQNKAKALLKNLFIGDLYKDLEYLPMDLGGKEYLEDMKIAQKYAAINRRRMGQIIIEEFFKEYDIEEPNISSIHNYIDLESGIIRKGAISAQDGEHVIIPFNMAEGVLIARGKGNKKYNYSAPHGAGRIYSRTRAKAELSLDVFKETMKKAGVWSSCIKESTLDECPQAYKDKNMVLRNIEETVEPQFFMKPIYNFKS